MFEDANVFTSFAVPPEDENLPFSYLPVPSMDILRHELQDRIKVRRCPVSLLSPGPVQASTTILFQVASNNMRASSSGLVYGRSRESAPMCCSLTQHSSPCANLRLRRVCWSMPAAC